MKFSVLENTYLKIDAHIDYFFNQQNYLAQKQADKFYLFTVEEGYKPKASLYLFENNNSLFSPLKATFGGIEAEGEKYGTYLLENLVTWFQEKDLQQIQLALAPECLPQPRLDYKKFNFQEHIIDKNYHIPVNDSPFDKNIHSSEKRRLKKCHDAGFTFRKREAIDLTFVYKFIKDCRKRKGYPMSLSELDFIAMIQAFPSHYTIFSVNDKDTIIALGVTVRLNRHVLYHFYPADHKDYQHYSPSVMLHKGIYLYCQSKNYKIFDLGIATDKGEINEGLTRFKKNLGAISSSKKTYILTKK